MTKKYSTYIMIIAMTIVMAIVMQLSQEYRFYAKEVEHLWLNDWMWIAPHFAEPGGVSQLLTSAMTQYWGMWGMGALCLALVFGCILFLGLKIQRSMCIGDSMLSFWGFPLGFMYLSNEHSYFNMKAHVALLIAVLISVLYIKLTESQKLHSLINAIVALILLSLSYWTAGSAAFVSIAVISIYEILKNKNWWQMIAFLVIIILLAGFSVKAGSFVDMEEALTPAQYYEWPASYNTPLFAWLGIPAVLLLGAFLSRKIMKEENKAKKYGAFVFVSGLIVSVLTIFNSYRVVHNPRMDLLRQDEWRARNQDWDGIIASHKGIKEPTPFISYLNLALAKKGQLVQRMAEFNPYIMWSEEEKMYSPVLMVHNEKSRDALKLQSCVFMEWGGAALANAQKSAFEANFLTPGECDPDELMRLVITNSLFNTEKTAQKYLRRLARTTLYGSWAEERLADPSLVNNDVEQLRRTLPDEDSFYYKTQVGKMLRQIVMQNPENKVAAQFYETYLIQSRDTVAYRHWKER